MEAVLILMEFHKQNTKTELLVQRHHLLLINLIFHGIDFFS